MAHARRLRLFIIGGQETSVRAVKNVETLGEVEIVDLTHTPEEADRYGILALPLLVLEEEGRAVARIVGDLSDLTAVRERLGL